MSAAPAARLRLVDAASSRPHERLDHRTELERLCAGEPVLLHTGLIAFANSDWAGLDPDRDPDDYRLAEVALQRFHTHVGQDRRTKGDRTTGIATALRRYVLPFAIELAAARPAPQRGAAHVRLQQAQQLPRILSGGQLLPAATVAGDQLGRVALDCIWLTLADAARVCTGGEAAVQQAVLSGQLPVDTERGGQRVVMALALRQAGLLREADQPHGLATSTAKGIIKLLVDAIEYSRSLGADVRGTFTLAAIAPLAHHRKRTPEHETRPYLGIADILAVCGLISPTHQLALWLMRLVGLRIGEAYGLDVSDFTVRGGRGWLAVETQCGQNSLVPDKDGKLTMNSRKPGTKTVRSTRTIPLCAPLTRLIQEFIRIYHTDRVTGVVQTEARLIPGLRSENDGGIAALRSALTAAFKKALDYQIDFDVDRNGHQPHGLRAALITDLENAKADERLARWYVGHESADGDVHAGYDLGPQGEEMFEIGDAIEALPALAALADLRVPTVTAEQWGRDTTGGQQRDQLRAELRGTGWLTHRRPTRVADGSATACLDAAGSEVDALELATLAGVPAGTARRWMRDGTLPAYSVAWGQREKWVSHRHDVDLFLAARHALTVSDQRGPRAAGNDQRPADHAAGQPGHQAAGRRRARRRRAAASGAPGDDRREDRWWRCARPVFQLRTDRTGAAIDTACAVGRSALAQSRHSVTPRRCWHWTPTGPRPRSR